MLVPQATDAETWAANVAQRQAALIGTIPLADTEAA
jgi:hypothetical protein